MKFSNELKGTLFVLLAAVCWSINSPIVKYLTLNPFLICGLRSLIAGIALLPFCGSGKSRKTVTCRCTSFHIPHFALP
ncbi:MAG: EamA family transporter [Acidaminococcus intestini]